MISVSVPINMYNPPYERCFIVKGLVSLSKNENLDPANMLNTYEIMALGYFLGDGGEEMVYENLHILDVRHDTWLKDFPDNLILRSYANLYPEIFLI